VSTDTETPPSALRLCKRCGGTMEMTGERETQWDTQMKFTCRACGHSRDFMQPGALGGWLLVGLLACAFLTFIFIVYDKWGPSPLGVAIVALFWIGYIGLFGYELYKHVSYPLTGDTGEFRIGRNLSLNRGDITEPDGGSLGKLLKSTEGMRIWQAPLFILALMILFLGAAALLGLVFDGGLF